MGNNDNTTTATDHRNLLGDLIVQAELLGPEGEGLDLDDLGLSRTDIAELRSRAATTRSAIDEVNRALARTWIDQLPDPKAVAALDDRRIGRIIWSSWEPRWNEGLEDAALGFATWLKAQPAETIAAVVSKWSRKLNTTVPAFGKRSVPPAVWDTFVETREEDRHPRLEVTDKAQIETKWIQRLAAGDVGLWGKGKIDLLEQGPTPPTERCSWCGRFYTIRTANKHDRCARAQEEGK